MFKRKTIAPSITQRVELTLYDVTIELQLARDNYEATLYFSSKPDDRYADDAIKQKRTLKAKNYKDLLQQVDQILDREMAINELEQPSVS